MGTASGGKIDQHAVKHGRWEEHGTWRVCGGGVACLKGRIYVRNGQNQSRSQRYGVPILHHLDGLGLELEAPHGVHAFPAIEFRTIEAAEKANVSVSAVARLYPRFI